MDQLHVSTEPQSRVSPLRTSSAARNPFVDPLSGGPVSNLPSYAAAIPPKSAVNRPQQLLELAGKVTRAMWGGIGLLSEGELIEHLTFGIADPSATQLARSSWFGLFIRFLHNRPTPATRKDLVESGLPIEPDAPARDASSLADAADPTCGPLTLGSGLPPLGSFLGVPLHCPGHYEAALYLARSPEQPPFDAVDESTVLSICSWIEQARIYDATHLLTRLRLLNQVAQAAAGSLELERILAVVLHELDRHIPLQIGTVWLIEEPKEEARLPAEPDAPARPRAVLAGASGSAAGAPFELSSASVVLAAASVCAGDNASSLGLEVGLQLRIEETPFAVCLSDGQAVYGDLSRPVERNSRLAEQLAQNGATAYFAVPLRAGDRTIGVLQSICTRPSGFTNEQIQLLYLVSDLLGPAISNCRLFERLSGAYEELRMAQAHLIQAEKMRALGELAAGMAHDFNNSLCAVLGFLELTLMDKDLPISCRGYLESSRTCALDAAQTVHRVQDFARWQRNETAAELVDPNELVRQTVELTRHKWGRPDRTGEASITVEQYTEATASVNGNRAELREVLTNLVFNAVDAMPHGGSLVLRTWSTVQDVYLSVQDTGVGISESVRRRLFEPFFTTKGERGNGMGLSVSFGIIQRHNGEITVESVFNQGSTFTVRLPAAAMGPVAIKPALTEQTPSATGKSLRILVVEDEESIRRFLAVGLNQLGHRPVVTSNAQEALAAFAQEPFDVVVTDLGLPDISGEEVARQVSERSATTPVVLLTGWADQIKAETKAIAGVKYILGKPITLTSLLNTLTELCKT